MLNQVLADIDHSDEFDGVNDLDRLEVDVWVTSADIRCVSSHFLAQSVLTYASSHICAFLDRDVVPHGVHWITTSLPLRWNEDGLFVSTSHMPVVFRVIGTVWSHSCYMACDDISSISITVELLRPIDKEAMATMLGTAFPDFGNALIQATTAPLGPSDVSPPRYHSFSRSLFADIPTPVRRNSYLHTRDASDRIELTIAWRYSDARSTLGSHSHDRQRTMAYRTSAPLGRSNRTFSPTCSRYTCPYVSLCTWIRW